MKIINFINANILSLFGDFTILVAVYFFILNVKTKSEITYNQFIIFIDYYFYYLIIVMLLILMFIIEIFLTKHFNKNIINIEIRNKNVSISYKIFFFIGFTFSILNFIALSLYLILCFIIGLSNHIT